MTKTNKEFRSDLAQEMRDKFDKRNEELDRIEKSPYSEGLREQMRKELMDNFYAEIDEMKKRPGYEEARKTHLEEIKAKSGVRKAKTAKEKLLKEYEEKLAKADADISDSKKSYEDAQIAHRGKVEEEQELKDLYDLKDYREAWKERIQDISEVSKEKIIKSVENIPVKVITDEVGSRIIEFKIGGQKYKILDIDPMKCSDPEYLREYDKEDLLITDKNKYVLELGGMRGDDVSKRKNKKLKEYVKKKETLGFHIADIKEIKDILKNLGKVADLSSEADQIAMLMYLIGIENSYWLNSCDGDSRNRLGCSSKHEIYRWFNIGAPDHHIGNLCMIATEK